MAPREIRAKVSGRRHISLSPSRDQSATVPPALPECTGFDESVFNRNFPARRFRSGWFVQHLPARARVVRYLSARQRFVRPLPVRVPRWLSSTRPSQRQPEPETRVRHAIAPYRLCPVLGKPILRGVPVTGGSTRADPRVRQYSCRFAHLHEQPRSARADRYLLI